MAYEDQIKPQGALSQIAPPTNDASGMIKQLLGSRLQHMQNDVDRSGMRESALGQYQTALQANPMGGYTPTEHGFYSWLGNMGKMPARMALNQGIAAGGAALGARDSLMNKGEVEAAKVGYEDATGRDKLDIQELAALKGLAGGTKGTSPVVKMDKDGNMVVFDPVNQTSKIVHSSQRGEYQRIWSKAYEKAVSEQMDNPEQYAHGVAANVLGTPTPGTSTPGAPAGLAVGQEPSAPSVLQYQDKPELKRKEEFATGLEKGAIKDYEENIKPQAAIADSMLNTIGMLKQIPRTQDMFAPWREKLGAGLQAVGMDGSMVKEAENLQQVLPLLHKIANDRLLAAKGVQTEGDAQRAHNEFLKITDTQKAADFMYAWTEELARRNKFRKSVWEDSANTEGTMGKASKAWENTDYSQAAPVAILNGKPWTYTDWRNSFLKANPNVPLNETIEVWNKLARGGK